MLHKQIPNKIGRLVLVFPLFPRSFYHSLNDHYIKILPKKENTFGKCAQGYTCCSVFPSYSTGPDIYALASPVIYGVWVKSTNGGLPAVCLLT